jgi:hypothetical protein
MENMVTPNAPSALFDICTVWNQQLGDALFVDHAGSPIVLDQWPSQQTFANRFSLSIVEARKRHIYVGFTLGTNAKFSTLKALVRPLLAKYHTWIYQHTLAYNKLDLVPLGFLTRTNPRFHWAAHLAVEICDVITATYPHLSGAIRDKFEDEFYDYFDYDNSVAPPIALLAPADVNSGNEGTRAMEICVERADVPP